MYQRASVSCLFLSYSTVDESRSDEGQGTEDGGVYVADKKRHPGGNK